MGGEGKARPLCLVLNNPPHPEETAPGPRPQAPGPACLLVIDLMVTSSSLNLRAGRISVPEGMLLLLILDSWAPANVMKRFLTGRC